MAKMTHPKMMRGREVPNTTSPAPVYVVDDMTDDDIDDNELNRRLSEFEGTASQAVVEQPSQATVIKPKGPTSEQVQKALEKLIFIGRYTKEINLGGHKFELGTLTNRENSDLVDELINLGSDADIFTARLLTLTFALRKIDGVALDDIPIDIEFEDKLSKRMTIIDYLQVGIVERLHVAFEEMVKESESAIVGDNIKN